MLFNKENEVTLVFTKEQMVWLKEAVERYNLMEHVHAKESTVLFKLFSLAVEEFDSLYPKLKTQPFKLIRSDK